MLSMRSATTALCAVMLFLAAASSAFEVCTGEIALHSPLTHSIGQSRRFTHPFPQFPHYSRGTALTAHTCTAQVNGRRERQRRARARARRTRRESPFAALHLAALQGTVLLPVVLEPCPHESFAQLNRNVKHGLIQHLFYSRHFVFVCDEPP